VAEKIWIVIFWVTIPSILMLKVELSAETLLTFYHTVGIKDRNLKGKRWVTCKSVREP
jgi:hypothetical protein